MKESTPRSGTIYINPSSVGIKTEDSLVEKAQPSSHEAAGVPGASAKEGSHSFLFWLVVPFIIVWLTVGYFIGFVEEHPSWSKTGYAQTSDVEVKPYTQEFTSISTNVNQPLITLWFDDAWLSQYTKAYPILKQYGFPAAIAVATNAIEKTSYMNWAQLRILQGKGWEITNHSNLHDCTMQNWDQTKISQDLMTATTLLWKNKLTSNIFVTPCGIDSQTLRDEAKMQFIAYRTVNPGFNETDNLDPFQLKVKNTDINTSVDQIKGWVDEALRDNSWLILVFHKVGENTSGVSADEYNISIQDFAEIVSYINSKNIKVVVPSQIIQPK
jgi:hypothetical protein